LDGSSSVSLALRFEAGEGAIVKNATSANPVATRRAAERLFGK
jgi:hypothetical protein